MDDWRDLQEKDVDIALYARFKKYFEYLNTGFKGKRYNVFAYNGGLFKTDPLLDGLKIEDELLYRHTLKLSGYDFVSEVDVNILGHIFENSLNELDEIKARLEGQQVDKAKSKRKKDGVFYTPKYITKYIVDNTVGKLCTEKKAELGLVEEEYTTDRKRTIKTKQPLFDKLTTYRNWLLQLTICDPACGSGAFLNQALDFLINEHRYIDELQAKLLGDAMVLSDFENSILENNLFGVDLNEESVEIAKLSLWLRTAQPNRKLNDLNNNIKCGNSLIDDPAVAGDKAFNWHLEFPTIFPVKAKRAWHITAATHNSRYSQRMLDNHVQVGEPVWLSEKEEIIVTETIAEIVIADKLNVLAYNICGDHIHLVLVCEDEELTSIMQKIKSMSARACNIAMGRTIPDPNHNPAMEHAPSLGANTRKSRGTTQFHLWTRKFGSKEIVTEEQLNNTIVYVQNNRLKHQLSNGDGACSIASIDKAQLPNGVGACSNAIDIAAAQLSNGDGSCSNAIATIAATFICSISHAFRTEYKGGFDVVIGNPPYVRQELLGDYKEYFSKNFKVFNYSSDLFAFFYEKGFSILKPNMAFGFISNTFDKTTAGIDLRSYLSNKTRFLEYVDFTEVQIFEGATTYPVIIIARNCYSENNYFDYIKIPRNTITAGIDIKFHLPVSVEQKSLDNTNWSFKSIDSNALLTKISQHKTIREQYSKCYYGIKTGFNEAFIISSSQRNSILRESPQDKEIIKPFYEGKDISKWNSLEIDKYLLFTRRGIDIEKYPGVRNWLSKYKNKLEPRNNSEQEEGRKPGPYTWFEIQDSVEYYKLFESTKITWANLQNSNKFCFEDKGYYINAPSVIFPTNEKALLSILNSNLIWYFLTSICVMRSGGYIEVKPQYFEQIPIPEISKANKINLVEKADLMIFLNKQLQELSQKFQRTIQRKFNLEDLPGKLQNWYLLTYKEFIAELTKKKVKLSLKEEAEWEAYFLEEAKQALEIKSEIAKTDKEIDRMVYQLYGLTKEEIEIVEG